MSGQALPAARPLSMPTHMLNAGRQLADEIAKMAGFRGVGDALGSAFGLKLYPLPLLKIQLAGASLVAVGAFASQWVWEPPLAILVLLGLDVLNGIYGYRVAVSIKGEGFRWSEFNRTFAKLIATIVLLGLVKNTINSYAYYEPLADFLFGWLFTRKISKLTLKMAALKVQEQGVPKILAAAVRELLRSKLGPYLVDALQTKPRTTATAAAAAVPPADVESAASPDQPV